MINWIFLIPAILIGVLLGVIIGFCWGLLHRFKNE
jgi:gas vesicle protein